VSAALTPAGSPEQQLLEALARHYAGAEFSARSAAVDLDPLLWVAAGVARPDPAAVGRWLRVRKGVVAGYLLGNRKNRDGVALWRVRPAEPRQAAPAVPRDPAPLPAPSSETVPPKPPALPLATPWWAVPASAPPLAPGRAAERRGGASWWAPEPETVP
jgi:hypothetical protein